LGVIQPRVKDVGPEHFGVVSVDCAKARLKLMFADFYGRVLIKTTLIEHDRSGFEKAIQSVKQAINEHDIKDNIVCVEMTGTKTSWSTLLLSRGMFRNLFVALDVASEIG
jgi:transposase